MSGSRRDFLKKAGLGSAGLVGYGLFSGCTTDKEAESVFNQIQEQANREYTQQFNMHGYAAPALDVIRVGAIGLGSRGSGNMRRFAQMEGVEIRALCDLEPDRTKEAAESISVYPYTPEQYSGSEDSWKELCERDDIDLVIIGTPWHLHTPISIYAMENDIHAASEVPISVTLEESWKLIETSERTRKHCMMLSNPNYGDFQMMTLAMAREGFLGEIIHGEGAYIHDLMRSHLFTTHAYHNLWRLKENATRNGNLYPTHGLGTICQVMDINHGDKMDFIVSVSTNDFMMSETAEELAAENPVFESYVGSDFRGNMNTSIIRTQKGRTILLQHDVTSPRPGVRYDLISGTKGIAQARPPRFAYNHDGWVSDEEFASLQDRFRPEISKRVGEIARRIGGHGGIDTLMTWRLVDCLRNGIPLDMSVYDGVLWSAIAPLSEWSVANGGMPIKVPDFTAGSWKTNDRLMDIELERGGNTSIM
ncbi:MAG: Gfo/Idh/MocA family oxidoreductase [Balneolaceae bacterium]